MDAALVGAPVFKTVCVALILSQVWSIPTHLLHACEDLYNIENIGDIILSMAKIHTVMLIDGENFNIKCFCI